METGTQFENRIGKAMNLDYSELPTTEQARTAYGLYRAAVGFEPIPGQFLTTEASNTKLALGKGRFSIGLSLPPAKSSGSVNLCAFEDSCAADCVGSGGSNRFPTAKAGKQARLDFLSGSPAHALRMLVDGIDKAVRTHPEGVGVRLNIYSDLRWERILPSWFWVRFAGVQFFDYTKHPLRSRPHAGLPVNYRLTYSVSGRSKSEEITNQLAVGRGVAVVVRVRGGKTDLPDGTRGYRPLPVTGARVVDGDLNDRRYDDPAGALVVLRRKNNLPELSDLVRGDAELAQILMAVA